MGSQEKMRYGELDKTGKKLSVIGLGTWQLGKNPAKEVKAIKAGIKKGINFIDTAEIYGTEPIVGKAIAGTEGIFIATKVWPTHFHYNDVIRACDASLERLGVKTIDLYQLHWPNQFIPIDETMRAMEDLVKAGKIRYIGVCNFDREQLANAQKAMKKEKIVSNQVEYSPIVRDPEVGLLDYCKKQGISLIAYSPLGHGKLFSRAYKPLLDVLSGIGKKHGRTAAQVALNWLVSKEGVFVIPKVSAVDHATEDAEAASFKLEPEEMREIDGASLKFATKSLRDTVGLPLSSLLFFKRS